MSDKNNLIWKFSTGPKPNPNAHPAGGYYHHDHHILDWKGLTEDQKKLIKEGKLNPRYFTT